jgi:hypothetical protein
MRFAEWRGSFNLSVAVVGIAGCQARRRSRERRRTDSARMAFAERQM